MIKKIRRGINRFHPRGPKGLIGSIKQHLKDIETSRPFLRSQVIDVAYDEIAPPSLQVIPKSYIKSAISSDKILTEDMIKILIKKNNSQFVAVIDNAFVMGNLIFNRDMRLFCELATHEGECESYYDLPPFNRVRFPQKCVVEKSAIFLNYYGASNYYHWMVECLPGLKIAQKYRNSVESVVVPRNISNFHKETLRKLGFQDDTWVYSDANCLQRFRQLIVPSYSSGWCPHEWTPNWLQSQFLEKRPQSRRDRRLYISRADAPWRNASNEDEFIEFLKPFGFEPVILSNLNVEDQATLFNEASCIISVHGAGLTNLVFCRPETMVIEILPARWHSLCYLKLASIAKSLYYYVICDNLSDNEYLGPDGQGASITIPIGKFENFLSKNLN